MICIYCDRNIVNKGSLVAHQLSCILNPNRIKHTHSIDAGAKPGCTPWNKGKNTGRPSCWDDKFSADIVFVENSTYARHCVKRRILREKLIDYSCSICYIGPIWNGKPMPLILDHINGVNNDNRLINLRFVCSNCDSQLDTYKSKNRKKKLEA